MKIDYYQLIKYLEKKCTKPESEEVENWLSFSEENKKVLEEVKQIWENTGNATNTIEPDVKKAWKRIKLKTGIKEQNSPTFYEKTSFRWILRIAASIIVLIGIVTIFKSINQDQTKMISQTNFSMVKKEIHLNDGSMIVLNRNASVTYPENFNGKTRDLILTGEAFFKIARDPEHPFIIHASGAKVRVLGTSFNINTNDNSKVIVSVLEGKVAFKADNQDKTQIQLGRGEKGIFEKQTKNLVKTIITDENFLSWKTGILYFTNQKLDDASKVLSEYYSKTIVVEDEIKDRPITVTFDNQSINEVIEILELTLHLKADTLTDRIILKSSKTK